MVDEDLSTENARLRAWIADLQDGMYVNCVYCGHRYGPRNEVPATMADTLKEHIVKCLKHPMSILAEKHLALQAEHIKVLTENIRLKKDKER